MGQVFRCRHRREGFLAAVKLSRLPDNPDLTARAVREAQALARIRHPNVVRIFTGGKTDEGDAYLAMELLAGRDLSEGLPLLNPDAPMRQIASALEAVHRAGLVHRDVKPANILLTPEGRAVLLDFGLIHDPERTRLTATGAIAGTPLYLSPELAQGGKPTPVSDWWAWALTYFQVAEGEPPFRSHELMQIFQGLPPPELPFQRILEGDSRREVISRILVSPPEARLQNLAEIEACLEGRTPDRVLPSRPAVLRSSLSAPAPAPSRSATRWILAGTFLILIAALARTWPRAAPPGTNPVPPSGPLSSPRFDPWKDTLGRGRALLDVVENLKQKHPERDRLFLISWIRSEIPARIHGHVQVEIEDLAGDWERLSLALHAWLVQLRDWQRDHPEADSPFRAPEVRQTLRASVLPLSVHLLQDFLVDWVSTLEVSDINPMANLSGGKLARMDEFLNVTSNLRFLLEEWNPLPPCLLPLRVQLPLSRADPAPDLTNLRDPLRELLQDCQDPQDFWLTASALVHVVAYDPISRVPDPEARIELLRSLEAALDSPSCPATKRERALLEGRILVEIARMTRAPDLPAPRAEQLGSWFSRVVRQVRSRASVMPGITYTALWSTDSLLQAKHHFLYTQFVPPPGLKDLYREEFERPYRTLQSELRRQGRLPEDADEPDFPALRGRVP